jgi:hypothetical protein
LSLALTLTLSGHANSSRIQVDIPFDFIVGQTTLPAGEYTVERINAIQSALQIRNTENNASAVMVTYYGESSKTSQARSKLVFNRYGNTYFLSQVWEPGSTTARMLSKSRAERELIKKAQNFLAQNAAAPEIVTILAQ